MENLLTYGGIPAVALIIGISEILKKLGFNAKFIPIVNLFLGLGAGIALNMNDLKMGVFVGLAVGLSASGLYSGTKNISQSINK